MLFIKKIHTIGCLFLLTLTAQLFATNYYVIGNSSNNCTVQWSMRKPFVTGSDCACMQKSRNANAEWVLDLNHLTCNVSPQTNTFTQRNVHMKPANCDLGDHCTQFQCLQLLYEDNEMHPVDQETVSIQQCRIMDEFSHKIVPMPICAANGVCPT
jgi:hypothetical protein